MERETKRKGMSYLSSALKVTLGAGVALGGSYLLSRVSEKQETESSLSRLEQMLADLAETREEAAPLYAESAEPAVAPPRRGRGKKSVILPPEDQDV